MDNLPFILENGKVTAPNHPNRDTNYIGIGDKTLIKSRGSKQIPLPPNGTFLDYVAFYFGRRSPMLYEIRHGYNGVKQRKMDEIIYLVSDYSSIKKHNIPFVFFDGHAYHNFSTCYNQESDLTNVPWSVVNADKWNDTEEQPDRKRLKQAEFLAYQEVPISALIGIGVHSNTAQETVEELLVENNLSLKVKEYNAWYF